MSRRIRRPVTPVMSLTTSGSWTFIWTKAFCMRWTCAPALSISVVAVPQIAAQGDDGVGGAEAAAQEPQDVEVAEPFAVRDVALAAGEILDVARIDEDHLKAARLEDLEDGNPIDAGGFHRHVGDPAGRQPVGEAMEIAGEGRKATAPASASRSGGTATKCSADPQSMPAACGWSRSRAAGDVRGFGTRRRGWCFIGGLLYTDDSLREQGCG